MRLSTHDNLKDYRIVIMRRYLSLLPLLLTLVGPVAAQQIGVAFPPVPTATITTPGVVQPDNQTICLLPGGKLYSCSPLRTPTTSSAILASDMGGQVNFNGTNLTVTLPVITGSIFPTGSSTLVCNYNPTPLTVTNAGGGPTVVGYTVPGTIPGISNGSASCLQLSSDGATLYAAPTFSSGSGGLTATGTGQLISGGFHVTPYSNGIVTSGTKTIDCGNNPLQTLTNNGAFTLAMATGDQWCLLRITNGASAGVISFSGFAQGSNPGDALTTASNAGFQLELSQIAGVPHYFVSALGAPAMTLTGVTLSANQFTYGTAANTVIGAVNVTTTGGSFSGALSLSGTDASKFALSSPTLPSNLTCPSSTACPASGGPFNLNIVATQTGAANSPLSQPETITPYTTWNPVQKGADIALSNGNLTATSNATVWESTQTTASHSSGKYYWEFTSVSGGTSGNGIMFGIASTTPLSSYSGSTVASYGAQFVTGGWYNNGSPSLGLYPAGSQTSSYGIAVNVTTKLVWIRNLSNCAIWNTGGADPVSEVGGISIANVGGAGTNVYATFTGGAGGPSSTANFGQGTFTCPAPSGYTGGW
jgi:hypothetical protein